MGKVSVCDEKSQERERRSESGRIFPQGICRKTGSKESACLRRDPAMAPYQLSINGNRADNRELAPECMVLLKSNGDFPLAAPEKVALYGSGARRTILGKR